MVCKSKPLEVGAWIFKILVEKNGLNDTSAVYGTAQITLVTFLPLEKLEKRELVDNDGKT